jgi:hypothetical protein
VTKQVPSKVLSLSYSIQHKTFVAKEQRSWDQIFLPNKSYYLIRDFPQQEDSESTLTPYLPSNPQFGNRTFNIIESLKADHNIEEVIGVHILKNPQDLEEQTQISNHLKKKLNEMEVRHSMQVLLCSQTQIDDLLPSTAAESLVKNMQIYT